MSKGTETEQDGLFQKMQAIQHWQSQVCEVRGWGEGNGDSVGPSGTSSLTG